MNSLKKTARIAGVWYLVMALTGPVGLLIVPSQIVVAGNAAATAQNIISNEWLFRVGIVSNIICQISFVFLVLSLKELFKGVDERYSRLMVSLVIAAVPVAILIELTQLAALQLVNGPVFLEAFHRSQRDAIVMALLDLHEQGVVIAGIFWGLWLYPFGYLAFRSGLIPKILGILLMIGCFSYVIDSSIALLVPQYRNTITNILMVPLSVGEFSMVFWLLIWGVKKPQ